MTTEAPVVSTDVQRRFATAMRACTPAMRKFIRALPKHGWRPYSASAALKMSDRTVGTWRRRPRFIAALEIAREMWDADLDTSTSRLIGEYAALAFSSVQDAVDPATGKVLPVHMLRGEVAAAVQETEVNDAGELVPVKWHPKKFALETLTRMRNIAPKRVEITGKDGAPLMPPQKLTKRDVARRLAFLLAAGLHAEAQPAKSAEPPTT